jgi:AcrR family transcriptional regulator
MVLAMAVDASSQRPVGRPRRAAIDAAIVRAAVELMTEGGVEATTLTAVARRAGVARATVYLRWPTRSALIGAAARAAVGGQPMSLTGDVERDIRTASDFIRRIFEIPTFPAILPEMVRAVLARPPEISFDAVAPRRRDFARNYEQGAGASGFDPSIDPSMPFYVLLGTGIVHLMATGRAMTPGEATRLAELVIQGLRAG